MGENGAAVVGATADGFEGPQPEQDSSSDGEGDSSSSSETSSEDESGDDEAAAAAAAAAAAVAAAEEEAKRAKSPKAAKEAKRAKSIKAKEAKRAKAGKGAKNIPKTTVEDLDPEDIADMKRESLDSVNDLGYGRARLRTGASAGFLSKSQSYRRRLRGSKPMDLPKLKGALKREMQLNHEFENLPHNTEIMSNLPKLTDHKNRYFNILPNNNCRVVLPVVDDDPTSAYINASWMSGFGLHSVRACVRACGRAYACMRVHMCMWYICTLYFDGVRAANRRATAAIVYEMGRCCLWPAVARCSPPFLLFCGLISYPSLPSTSPLLSCLVLCPILCE